MEPGERARCHAALGDVLRVEITDALALSDLSPTELKRALGVESNLLAHHLDVLETAGIVERVRSDGDRRRTYVSLRVDRLRDLVSVRPARWLPDEVLFVCTHNSARSQIAAALWNRTRRGARGYSAGTDPAARVHPMAVEAAERVGLDLEGMRPRHLADVAHVPDVVIAVCDRAYEEAGAGRGWIHWSIADPARLGHAAAFDRALAALDARIRAARPSAIEDTARRPDDE